MTKLQKIIVVNLMYNTPFVDAGAYKNSHIIIRRVGNDKFTACTAGQMSATQELNKHLDGIEADTEHVYEFNRCVEIAVTRTSKWRAGVLNFAECISCDLLEGEEI